MGGNAQFPEDAEPVPQGLAAIDPCSLIPEDWLYSFELEEGKYNEADERVRAPHGCDWRPSGDQIGGRGVSVRVAGDMAPAKYDADIDSHSEIRIGGLDWRVSDNSELLEGHCFLIHIVDDESFVSVSSMNLSDETKACDKAEEVAPVIAAQLPGGDPAPEPPQVEESPVTDVDACELLAHDDAEEEGLQAPGEETDSDLYHRGCEWLPSEDSSELQAVVIMIDIERSIERRFDAEPDDTFEVADRSWKIFDSPSEGEGFCYVGTDTSPRSYVAIFSSNHADPDSGCDQATDLAPLVTGNLPAS
ncbi:DUF3558 family protein [Haloechinothrix sp. YIM 98757]|uniref:DUF3558 family protein n=1 Tax=Haloechinothrix aidingensis TaxID=2752311 RepID=A0A838A8F3_9PSEU|nr:DUF3558 family protein [Haloechinothrix aidingensis]